MEQPSTKVIFAGQLEFGTSRNFENVQSQYMHRMENYYKNDILLKPETIFNPDDHTMDIPRTVVTSDNRQYKNTVNLLERMASFSISGDLNIWRLEGGQIVEHLLFEPRADRTTNQLFQEGRKLVDQKDDFDQAQQLLTQAINKFERHASAYERRGLTNYRLGNYKDALYDYDKSISIYPSKPETYYGRGLVYLKKLVDLDKAIADFGTVAKYAIPHQPIYWLAKVMRADALLEADKKEEAMKEYKAFVHRKQRLPELDHYDRRAAYQLAELQRETGRPADAVQSFQRSLEAPPHHRAPQEPEIKFQLGLAMREAGIKDWMRPLGEAAEAQHEAAKKMLESLD